MGVMSKSTKVASTRLPERPKAPAWEDIISDVSNADRDDVVFTVGKDNLPVDEKGNVSSTSSTSAAADGDLDTSHPDLEAVQASYANVLDLISSHERLCVVPATLREQYSNLQETSESRQAALTQLRALQKTLVVSASSAETSSGGGDNKSKSKHKKKK